MMHLDKSIGKVSYIVMMDLVTVEDYIESYGFPKGEPTPQSVTCDILYRDLLEHGTRIMVEGRELYSKVYSFDQHKDCKFEDSFEAPVDQVSFSSMVEKDVWGYIYGRYLLKAELAGELDGFAAIRI